MSEDLVFPRALHVGGNSIQDFTEESWETVEDDPRGLLLMWAPPIHGAKYIVGVDSSEGITGWTRGMRSDNDHKVDNGVIEIFRVDGQKEINLINKKGIWQKDINQETGKPNILTRDVQVAEFAAPCDAVEIARIANVLGRIYCGDADDQAELILESWPGCGMLALQELLRLNYGNLWHWEFFADTEAQETNRIGWHSSNQSQRMLWTRSRRHLMQRKALIRSKFLLAEYSNAEIDMEKMRAKAASGFHDDRFMAANLCFWAGHKWTYDIESTSIPVTETPAMDYQRMATTLEDHISWQDWRAQAIEAMED